MYFQVKLARGSDTYPSEESPELSASESLKLVVNKTRDELKISLENIVSNGVQGEVVDNLQPFLHTTVNEEKIPNITFNHIAEDVYLHSLHMTFRKMGYHSMFTRYNGDKGMAVFQREDPDEHNVRKNVYRSRKPNIC